jgi:hypothetical protein
MDEINVKDVIYKVKQIKNDEIKRILVFSRNEKNNNVFTQYENEIIKNKNIEVIFCDNIIFQDDDVITVKIKILYEMRKIGIDITFDELYLYCVGKDKLDINDIYQSLTNQSSTINPNILNYILSNIIGFDSIHYQYKEEYEMNDLKLLNLEKYTNFFKPLGEKSILRNKDYPIISNPFKIVKFDSFVESISRTPITQTNLLMNSDIKDNTIYVSNALDVIEYATENSISIHNITKTYYPSLFKKDILTLEDLNNPAKREVLMKTTNDLLEGNKIKFFENIDLFHKINFDNKTSLKYIENGLGYINFTLIPVTKGKIPLENIFKILNSSPTIPMIKYNPSSKQEKTLRLYCEAMTKDGRKIPILKKGTIFKLIKNIINSKTVTAYIEYENEKIYCEFDENGNINVKCDLFRPLHIKDINILIKQTVGPIIENIQEVFEESGYNFSEFTDLNSDNIFINNISYVTSIKGKKKININAIEKCISQVFLNETSTTDAIMLRFKRVANFNTYNSKQIFIINKINEKIPFDEIVTRLHENYKNETTLDECLELVRSLVNEQNLKNISKGIRKFKNNPGFDITINIDSQQGNIIVEANNLDDLKYLNTLPIYIDSLIKISQYYDKTSSISDFINKLCEKNSDDLNNNMKDAIVEVEKIQQLPDFEKKNEIEEEKSNIFDDDDDFEDDDFEESDFEESDDDMLGGNEHFEGNDDTIEINEDKLIDNPHVMDENELQDVSEIQDNNNNNNDSDDSDNNDLEESSDEENENIDYDNIKLNKPYYFQSLIEEKDPTLILKDAKKGFNTYSRTCSSSNRRQPVILTDKQLDKIKTKYGSMLDSQGNKIFDESTDVIKYGSNANNKYNYICPRYWCLKNNTMIHESELKEVTNEKGETELEHPTCGKVLPYDATTTKPGYYIYEFVDKTGKYQKNYPVFQTGKHPDGFCLPCCFTKANTAAKIKAKKDCYAANKKKEDTSLLKEKEPDFKPKVKQNVNEPDLEQNIEETNMDQNVKINDLEQNVDDLEQNLNKNYVKSSDKFPIEKGRWGYLPLQIQFFLKENNYKCQISSSNTQLKTNHPCLLRHGVEVNSKQSFLSCISDALYFAENKSVLSIVDFKNHLISILTIDDFVNYNNGNLIRYFYDLEDEINIEEYKNTKTYKTLKQNKKEDITYYKKIVSAFNNFIEYLKDDEIFIDYSYLWDIICTPNPKLFSKGLNLIIMEISDDDITNNIGIVCPTNYYTNNIYNPRKPCLFLIKKDDYYEPIYSRFEGNKISIMKTFSEYKVSSSNQEMKNILQKIIKPYFNKLCLPKPSLPNVYKFKRPYDVYKMITLLELYNYHVQLLIKNFNNKIIGLIAINKKQKNSKNSAFVPCFPSYIINKLIDNYDFVYMNNPNIWTEYSTTFDFLKNLSKKGKNRTNEYKIFCEPKINVFEGEYITGILTETNQYVQVNPPIKEEELQEKYILPSIKYQNNMSNLNNVDIISSTSSKKDNERIEKLKLIQMETKFYNIFRNTVKILLNNFANYSFKTNIMNILDNLKINNYVKLSEINNEIKTLIEGKIEFTGDEYFYKEIEKIVSCHNTSIDKCDENKLCVFTDDNICSLILPKNNLLTKKINKDIYLQRISDELVRYTRIQKFMFDPNSYLSLGKINYNLNENELLIIQSLITQDFFENLNVYPKNKYVSYNSFFNATPQKSQKYDNTIDYNIVMGSDKNVSELKEKQNDVNEINCEIKEDNISSLYWKSYFPKKYSEFVYSNSVYCTFKLIMDLIKTPKTILELKQELLTEYRKYNNFNKKIIDILITEGKEQQGKMILNKEITFEDYLMSENYYLTVFDLWLLIKKYNLSVIFISHSKLLTKMHYTQVKDNKFIANGNREDKFIHIIVPTFIKNKIPSYSVIIDNEKNDKFPLNSDMFYLFNDENKKDITMYLQNYIKYTIKKIHKKSLIVI